MPRAHRQLRNTDQLKQARNKVDSIAGYYKDYKKKANDGYGGVVSIGRVTVGQARANDYIRAHKDDIWKYRTAFTVQYNAEHPRMENNVLNERPVQEIEGHDEAEGSSIHEGEGDLSMNSGSLDTGNNAVGEHDSNVLSVGEPQQEPGPNDLNGIEEENQAPAREGEPPEGEVKAIADLERIEAFDLGRCFMGNMRNMLSDYFAITKPGGVGNENLAELDTKQSGRGVLSDELDKADGRKSAAGGDPMNSNLTPGQEKGLSEIAKFLYQNCAIRKRNKITLLDGLLLRSARERLLIYYLVENDKYDSPSEDDIVQSQIYTPNIQNFKDKIERSSFNIFGRMFIGSMHWSYLSKAAQVAMDCREKLAFMAASGMFGQRGQEMSDDMRRKAGSLLDKYPISYTALMHGHNLLDEIDGDEEIIRVDIANGVRNNNPNQANDQNQENNPNQANDQNQENNQNQANDQNQDNQNQDNQNQDNNQNLDNIDDLSDIAGDGDASFSDQSMIRDLDGGIPGMNESDDSIDLSRLEDDQQDGGAVGPAQQSSGSGGQAQQSGGLVGQAQQSGGLVGQAQQSGGLVGQAQQSGGLVGQAQQSGGLVGQAQQSGGLVGQTQQSGGSDAPVQENRGDILQEGVINVLDPGSENHPRGDIDRPNPHGFAADMTVMENEEKGDVSGAGSSYYEEEEDEKEPAEDDKEAAEVKRLQGLNLHAPVQMPKGPEDNKIFNDGSSYYDSRLEIESVRDLEGQKVVSEDPNESGHTEILMGNDSVPAGASIIEVEIQNPEAPAHEEQPVIVQNQEQPVVAQNQEQPVVVQNQNQPEIVQNQEQPVVVQNQEQPVIVQNQEQPVVAQNQNRSVIVQGSEQPVVAQNQNRSVIVENRNQPVPAPAPAPGQEHEIAGNDEQQRVNAHERLIQERNEAFTLAMDLGNAYVALWKSKGALPETQMSWEDNEELKSVAKAYTVALRKMVEADNRVIRNVPDAPQPMQGNVPYNPNMVGKAIKKGLTQASSVTARKQEYYSEGIVKRKNAASLGYIATTSVTMADKARNIGMVLNSDMWSGSGNWNWGNPDFGKHLSGSMASKWGWRINGVFPKIEGYGTGLFTTIGAIAALATFAQGLSNMGATFSKGSAGDIAKHITSQLGLLVSASKDAMLDTVAWNTIFNGSISPQTIANLSSAAAVAGVIGGAINIALGAASIHEGRSAKRKLDDISDWVEQSVRRGRNQNASPEQQRESEIINTANAAARRKADRNIRGGVAQTVSGALFMIGGILSMSVAGAPLGAALMLLGGGLTLVNTIAGYAKSRQRKRAMIDDYIGINTLVRAVKRYDRNAANMEDDELAGYIREEAIGLMGFTSENGFFDYIAGRLSKALTDGIRKNARTIDPDELRQIVDDPYAFRASNVQAKKQVANYILMIQSFGPKVKVTRNREFSPNEAALAKAIAKV